MAEVVNWGEVRDDVLMEIAKNVKTVESLYYFRQVCKSWQRAATDAEKYCPFFEGPWLMQIHKEEEEEDENKDIKKDNKKDEAASPWREFISVSLGGKVRRVFLPELINKKYLSCKDWLFTISEDYVDTSLLHPLSRTQIHLPNLKSIPEYYDISDQVLVGWTFVHKVVLSADPRTCTCTCPDNEQEFIVVVMVSYPMKLYFCKPGRDISWTKFEIHENKLTASMRDMIYFNNKLYVLHIQHFILTCDLYGPNPTQLLPIVATPETTCGNRYLVECCGNLLLVYRHMKLFTEDDESEDDKDGENDSCYHHKTVMFKVYELGPSRRWKKLKDLGNRALFLGGNTSYSIGCSEFNNIKPNSIYFTDGGNGRDMGIYNFADRSFTPFCSDEKNVIISRIAPPIWIGPSF